MGMAERGSYLEEATEMWDDTFRWDPRHPLRTYRRWYDRVAIRGLAVGLAALDVAISAAKPVLRPYWRDLERHIDEYDDEYLGKLDRTDDKR